MYNPFASVMTVQDPTYLSYAVALPEKVPHSRNTSASSVDSLNSRYAQSLSSNHDNAPLSAITTPAKSPIGQNGPLLLPKIRTQDSDNDATICLNRHYRSPLSLSALSAQSNGFPPHSFDDTNDYITSANANHYPFISPIDTSPIYDSGISPSGLTVPNLASRHILPVSSAFTSDAVLEPSTVPHWSSLHAYTPSHTRSHSNVQPAQTYYVPTAPSRSISPQAVRTKPASHNRSHSLPTGTTPVATRQTVGALPQWAEDASADTETTLTAYMTSKNPCPTPTQQIKMGNRLRAPGETDYWWDIRNLSRWESFSLSTIDRIVGLPQLLNLPISASLVPEPTIPRSLLRPEQESDLLELVRAFYAAKLNAVLPVSQGFVKHMVMTGRASIPTPSGRRAPADFTSSYPTDSAQTAHGEPRGRVVGLVRSFNRWNSGMRHESPSRQVDYLAGLATLHRHMREHQCRYGFIITEIELLCVKAVTEAGVGPGKASRPVFGALELAPVVKLSEHQDPNSPFPSSSSSAQDPSGNRKMTACQALWFLHMLAKQEPLPGQQDWRLEVGHPSECSRRNCRERDSWMPRIGMGEKRDARRIRGWVMPEEGLSRKEVPKMKRRGKGQGGTRVQVVDAVV